MRKNPFDNSFSPMKEGSIRGLKLFWAATPFHTKISYQYLNGMNVNTADKLVIARGSTLSPLLLRTLIWYEKYEIVQDCQTPLFKQVLSLCPAIPSS